MQAPPPPTPPALASERKPPLVWPHSAQLATAFLAGIATALLAVYVYSCRFGGKPSDLERGVVAAYRIDLNRANRAELLQLPGIGEALVQRVEDYRQTHGGFRTVEELRAVHGIGPTTLERLRPWVRVGAEQRAETVNAQKQAVQVPALAPTGKKTDKLRGPIDVNHATLDDLQLLPGIGPKMSQRIVDQREKAPFKSVDELRRVAGIGPKILERLRPYVVVTTAPGDVAKRNDS